jgi:hypothetical protein
MNTKQFHSVEKARTIASFVKKNNFFVQFSNNPLSQFLCDELSKCNSDRYTYRLDNVEIEFYLDTQNGDARKGGYLCCVIYNTDNWDVKRVFNSFEGGVKYNDNEEYKFCDVILDCFGKEVNRIVLFKWDKIMECMERCF